MTASAPPRHSKMPREIAQRYAAALRLLDRLWPDTLTRYGATDARRKFLSLQHAAIDACEYYRASEWQAKYKREEDALRVVRSKMNDAADDARNLSAWIAARPAEATAAMAATIRRSRISVTRRSADPMEKAVAYLTWITCKDPVEIWPIVATWRTELLERGHSDAQARVAIGSAVQAWRNTDKWSRGPFTNIGRLIAEGPIPPAPSPVEPPPVSASTDLDQLLAEFLAAFSDELEAARKAPVWRASINRGRVLASQLMRGQSGVKPGADRLLIVELEAIMRRFSTEGKPGGEWEHEPRPETGDPQWPIVAEFAAAVCDKIRSEDDVRALAAKFKKNNPEERN